MHTCGAEPQRRGGKGKGKEMPVIDPATMSLKAIIKCAYAQERIRMEDERRRKVLQSFSSYPLRQSISASKWCCANHPGPH